MQGLGGAEPGLAGDAGEIQLAKGGGHTGHDHNGDEGRCFGEEILAAIVVQGQHDDNGACGQEKIDGIAVVGGAVPAGTIADAHAAEAQAQSRDHGTGDIGLENIRELLMERGPKHDGDNAAHQAGAGISRQPILRAQSDAGGHEHEAALQGDGQPGAHRAKADRLDNGGNTGDQQTAGHQDGDLCRAQAHTAADKQRHGQHVEYQNDDLLEAEGDGFAHRRTLVQRVSGWDLFHRFFLHFSLISDICNAESPGNSVMKLSPWAFLMRGLGMVFWRFGYYSLSGFRLTRRRTRQRPQCG